MIRLFEECHTTGIKNTTRSLDLRESRRISLQILRYYIAAIRGNKVTRAPTVLPHRL